ncbi:hypothetical protein BHE74_00030702 [Ensete ventricosum]|nr:hypothetical protein GW17_00053202 [Ensete ventricosum]RWW62184.1 hypothetical protein BHE74_00030702 [Ensete ventricosum]
MAVVTGATGVTRRSSNGATSGCYDADSEEGRDNSDGDNGDAVVDGCMAVGGDISNQQQWLSTGNGRRGQRRESSE